MLICKCQRHVSFLIKQQQARGEKAEGCKLHVVDVGWRRASRPRCQLFGCFWLRHIMIAVGWGAQTTRVCKRGSVPGAVACLVPQNTATFSVVGAHSCGLLKWLRALSLCLLTHYSNNRAWDDYYNQPWSLSPSRNKKMDPICNLKVQLLVCCM